MNFAPAESGRSHSGYGCAQAFGSAGADAAQGRGILRWIAVIAREPLIHFLLLGGVIWAAAEFHEHRRAEESRYTIRIGPAERELMAAKYAWQFGRAPTPEQLHALIERHVQEEIFLREGLALKLDEDDEIIRRRVIQKYEFLQTDLQVTDDVAPEALQSWFERNQSRYRVPERIAFDHVYFAIGSDGEETARARATDALGALRTHARAKLPRLGDPFPGPATVGAISEQEAVRLFGESELTEHLFELPPGEWSGPYRSGYGWHLVYVTGRLPAELPALATIRERVLADYQAEQRELANARLLEALRKKYTVVTDDAP